MKRQKEGWHPHMEQKLYFQSDLENPVGYLRSGGQNIQRAISHEPNSSLLYSRPYYVLSMALRGCNAIYYDERKFTSPISYGNFVLTLPNFRYRITAGRGGIWAEINVGFSGKLFDLYQEWGVLQAEHVVYHLEDPQLWIGKLHGILEAPRPKNSLAIIQETTFFASFLAELLQTATPKQYEQSSRDWFTHACAMLTNDFSQKVDLQKIAESIGMSYDVFRIRFAKRAGVPPMKYRNDRRTEFACDLLKNSNKSVEEIAYYLGFNGDKHLATFLKRRTRLSPNKYRKRK